MRANLKPIAGLAILAALGVVASAAPAAATVLFDQPLDNSSADGGAFSNDPNQLVADSFSLSSNGQVDSVSWYGAAYNGQPFSDFEVQFRADDSGAPGTLLASSQGAATAVDQGVVDPYGDELFQFSRAIPTFNAAAGVTYWFTVADLGPSNFVWATSSAACCSYFTRAGAWVSNSGFGEDAQALTLFGAATGGVPEPAAWSLMILGFGGLGAMLRRRQRRTAIIDA
jgi:hypothetical protein